MIAHLDTVRTSPGADDNASGVATVLELARQLDRTHPGVVLAIVDLEEIGHLGSKQLAAELPRPGLVVCLDSVGYYDDAPRTQTLPAGFGLLFPDAARDIRIHDKRGDFLLVIHRDSSRPFTDQLRAAADREELRTVSLRDPRWNGRGQSFTRWINPVLFDLDRSDHEPFWRRGVPAVFLSGTAVLRNHQYHRADDTPERLDYQRMARLTRALASSMA